MVSVATTEAASSTGWATLCECLELETKVRYPVSGAEGIRTPGLLIANETRYQLRHSPKHQTGYPRLLVRGAAVAEVVFLCIPAGDLDEVVQTEFRFIIRTWST